MTNLTLLGGRILLAASFAPGAVERLANVSGFAAALAAKGVPYAPVLAAFCAVAGSFGPLALVLGVAPRLTAAALVAHTLLVAGTLLPGPLRPVDRSLFAAQLAVIGGLLYYAAAGPGPWSLSAWWRREAPAKGRAPAPKARKPASPRAPRPKAAPREPAEA